MLCDDSATVRSAFARVLESDPDLQIVAGVGDGQQALDALMGMSREARPHVLLLDLEMPVMDGMTALPLLLKAHPNLAVIVSSAQNQSGAAAAMAAIRAGAADYVPKPSAATGGLNDAFRADLLAKVKGWARMRGHVPGAPAAAGPMPAGPGVAGPGAAGPGGTGPVAAAPAPGGASPGGAAAGGAGAVPPPPAAPGPAPGPPPGPAAPALVPGVGGLPSPGAPAAPVVAPAPAFAGPAVHPPPRGGGHGLPLPHPPSPPGYGPGHGPGQGPGHGHGHGPGHSLLSGPVVLRPMPPVLPKLRLLAIGSSTGGPQALAAFVRRLGGALPVPVVVVQHMPAGFTAMLADHLGRLGGPAAAEAREGEALRPGRLYVAPGDRHLMVEAAGGGLVARLTGDPPENFCRPAVDPMLRSAVSACDGRVLAVILTGMGQDGLLGCKAVASAGGLVLAQDEASSVVWGMPGAVAKAGLAQFLAPPEQLADKALAHLGTAGHVPAGGMA